MPRSGGDEDLGTELTDTELVALVRRYRPSSLVPLVSATAARHMTRESWLARGVQGLYAPWVLAEIARISLAHGNAHRQPATREHLDACCAAFNSVGDPQLGSGDPDGLASFLLRISSEQLEYQTRLLHEMSRTAALFDQTPLDPAARVLVPGWQEALFGASLVDFVGAGQLLHFSSQPNGGLFDPAWLNAPHLAPVVDVMGADLLRQVWKDNYLTDVAGFQAVNGRPDPSPWRRFDFNPLAATPVVTDLVGEGKWIIPSPGLLARKFSPLGVYYAGVRKWGNAFSDELGPLFEAYVGRQLRELPGAQVIPAVTYGHDNSASVDWFVILPEVVLMVEVKSVRPTDQVRRGGPQAGAELTRMLSRAFEQLGITNKLIEQGHPSFSAIPDDRPRVGLVVTMENFHMANSPFQRDRYRQPTSFPTLVVSVSELEDYATITDVTPGALLLDLLHDSAREGWSLHSAFVGRRPGRNAVLEQAWDNYPWSNLEDSAAEHTT